MDLYGRYIGRIFDLMSSRALVLKSLPGTIFSIFIIKKENEKLENQPAIFLGLHVHIKDTHLIDFMMTWGKSNG